MVLEGYKSGNSIEDQNWRLYLYHLSSSIAKMKQINSLHTTGIFSSP